MNIGNNRDSFIAPIPVKAAMTWLFVIVVIAAVARLVTLGDQSLWLDEFLTIKQSSVLAEEGLMATIRGNQVSPFYNIVTALLLKAGLTSEFWLRLPSALAGIAAVPVCYLLAIRLFNNISLGLAAALLIAISPLTIWYSQEARSYSFLMLDSMLLVYFSWPIVNANLVSRARLLVLTLCTVAGYYIHPYIFMTSASLGLFFLAAYGVKNRSVWLWVITQLIGILFFLPWLLIEYTDGSAIGAGSPKPLAAMWIPYTLYAYVAGFSLGPTVAEMRMTDITETLRPYLPLFFVASIASIGAFYAGLGQILGAHKRAAWLCLVWLFIPMLLAILVSAITGLNYNVRYVIGAYPAIAIIIAGTFVAVIKRSRIAVVSISLLLAITLWSLSNWYTNPRYAKADIRNFATVLSQESVDDSLWLASLGQICSFIPYYGLQCPESTLLVDDYGASLTDAVAALHEYVDSADSENKDILLIEYRPGLDNPRNELKREIESMATLIESKFLGIELSVSHYQPKQISRLPIPGTFANGVPGK